MDNELEDKLRCTALAIEEVFPDTKFALVLFDPTIIGGTVRYIGNTERDDMLACMKEFIAASEGRRFATPEFVQ